MRATVIAITYPVPAQLTVAMLQHIVDETPDDSDGAAVAAMAANYIADVRTEGKEKESLTFFTKQILAGVAKRHRNIEEPEMINTWIEILELNDRNCCHVLPPCWMPLLEITGGLTGMRCARSYPLTRTFLINLQERILSAIAVTNLFAPAKNSYFWW